MKVGSHLVYAVASVMGSRFGVAFYVAAVFSFFLVLWNKQEVSNESRSSDGFY
jgi:hypothetical protein